MSSLLASADWQSKILKKEYQNWLAVGHALSLMLDGLRPYIEREVKAFHGALLANLATVPPCTCPKPTKHTCAWATQVIRCHRGGKPKWHQSDPTLWTDPRRGYWEVAKVFMSDLGTSKATVVDASTTDCTGLINLLFWCVHFRVQVPLVEAVRETRNTKWGHAPRQELTDAEKADALDAIRDLLQDPELAADSDAKSAIAEINLMEKAFDAQSVERKVLADFQVSVHDQLGDIEVEMKEMKAFKTSCKSLSNKIQKKLLSLEKRQKKLLKLFENISNRMEEEETRKISYTTLAWNLLERMLTKSKRLFVRNVRSLNTKSVAVWLFLLVLLGWGVTKLDHNSYNDGRFKRSLLAVLFALACAFRNEISLLEF